METYNPPRQPYSMDDIYNSFLLCSKKLNEVHRRKNWIDIEKSISKLRNEYEGLSFEDLEEPEIRLLILPEIALVIKNINLLIDETAHEIEIYEIRNRKVRLHGTATVTIFGLVLILFLTIGSFRFIRIITKPIYLLVNTTKKIANGSRNIRAGVNSNDEFMELADSFNVMLDKLNETTVSEEYLNKIINNLYGALLVTDDHANILSINAKTTIACIICSISCN